MQIFNKAMSDLKQQESKTKEHHFLDHKLCKVRNASKNELKNILAKRRHRFIDNINNQTG